MKTTLTIAAMFIAGTLSLLHGQSGPLNINVYTTSISSTGSPVTDVMFLSFLSGGNDSLDSLDISLGTVPLNHEYCVPFTNSADNEFMRPFDNRGFFTGPKVIPFGMLSNYASNVSFTTESTGSVPDYNSSAWNEEVGNIYLEDLSTGIMHDIYGDTITLPVPVDTVPVAGFRLHLYPALFVTTAAETCNGYGDGSMHIVNPGSTNWILLVVGPTGMFSMSVAQTDTLLDMLPPGTYQLTAFTDGLLSDHQSVTIPPRAAITPSFTASTTTAGQNIAINFTNTTTGNFTWLWEMGDGNYYTSTNASHAYSAPGAYNVRLTATDSIACSGDTTITVTINLLPPSAPPQVWDPNSSPNHNSNRTARGPEVALREANTMVITSHEDFTVQQVEVYSVNGQLITSQQTNSNVTEIQLPQAGCYIVNMTMSNGEIRSERVISGL